MQFDIPFPHIAMMRSAYWITAAVFLALAISQADAQSAYTYTANTLFKCVSRSGAVTIQQEPCAGKAKTAWRREAAPEAAPSYAQQVRRAREGQKRAQDARALSHLTGTDQQPVYVTNYRASDQRDLQRAQCQQARANREPALKQLGRSASYQQLQALDAAIYDACHGLDM